MGRYYNGDIEGKFWFGVQSSDDAEYFGAEPQEPNEINYFVEDIEKVKEGIDEVLKELGNNKKKLDIFFGEGGKGENGYNDEMLMDEFKMDRMEVTNALRLYARLELGQKILECLQENGECNFTAEI